jgi:hypothetical protein
LQVLLPVKHDGLDLDFSILDIDFVATESNRNVLTDPGQISMPIRDILVSDSGSDIKHDDRTLSLNVVSIPESSELLLTCSIPDVESNDSSIGVENEGMYFYSEGCCA